MAADIRKVEHIRSLPKNGTDREGGRTITRIVEKYRVGDDGTLNTGYEPSGFSDGVRLFLLSRPLSSSRRFSFSFFFFESIMKKESIEWCCCVPCCCSHHFLFSLFKQYVELRGKKKRRKITRLAL